MSTSVTVVPRFRVAVCGAGPAGLTIASTIVKFSDPASPIAVDVYESRQVVDTVGAGIVVWERTHALAEDLGLMDTLKTELGPTESPDGPKYSITYRKSDDNEGYDFFRFVPLRAPMALHRRALIDSLISTLPPESSCNIHTSSHLTSFSYADPATHSGPITLRFKDGSTRTADIVIGTDGVRSAVRNSMFSGGIYDNTTSSSAVQPVWTGKIVYRALALPEKLLATPNVVPQALTKAFVYCGQDRHVVAYPIANGKFINIVAFVDVPGGYRTTYKGSEGGKWVHDVSTAEVVASYPNWEPEVLALLQSPDKYSAWAMHAIEDAPHAVIGKAAIVGDALHAMETHFAAGVGQAMEDAYVLGRLLSHSTTTLSTVPSALAAYEDTRLAFGIDLVHRSRAAGQLYEFRTGVVPDGRVPIRETTDGIHLLQKGEDWATRWAEQMMELWNWQWEELPEDIWQRALKNFQERTQQLK